MQLTMSEFQTEEENKFISFHFTFKKVRISAEYLIPQDFSLYYEHKMFDNNKRT